MKVEIFTLGLYSERLTGQGGFVVNNSSRANITYQVDFNALFQGRENDYDRCRIRAQLITNNMGQTDLDNVNGYLAAVGFSDTHRLGLSSTFLTPLDPVNSSVTGTTGFYYNSSSYSDLYGSEINIPKGLQQFNIQFLSESGNLLTIAIAEHFLVLQFELIKDD